MRNKLALSLVTLGTLLLCLASFAPQLQSALQAIWTHGDLFVGDAKGHYLVYANGGTFKETLDNGVSGFATGCEFNNDFSQLYTTAFSAGQIVKFASTDPHVRSSFGTPGQLNPESIVFKTNGGFFVGGPRSATILEYDASDNLIMSYSVAPTDTTHGTDWIELSSNQTTLFYTGEGRVIKRYDTAAGQLADFARLPGFGAAYALRLLPPFDGTGGLIVADRYDVKRLNGNGNVIQSYSVPNIKNAFSALNLDPDGTTFWAGSYGVLYRFNIAAGGAPIQMIDVPGAIAGVCLKAGMTPTPTPTPTATPTPPPCGVVTTTADSGAGSLRAVLTCANGSPALDSITFNIPSSDPGCHNVANVGTVCTITPATQLPAIIHPVTIDGYTQPGAQPNTMPNDDNAKLLIELNGALTSGSVSGLQFQSHDGSTVRGLVVNNWAQEIRFFTGNGHTLAGCFIGTNADASAAGTTRGTGVHCESSQSNMIGGSAPADRNIISGNGIGVLLQSAGTQVQGNFIGTDRHGTMGIPNSNDGIQLGPNAQQTRIGGSTAGAGNVISANQVVGIRGTATMGLRIQGNFIGTDVTGNVPLGNSLGGISLAGDGNQGSRMIGGSAAGEGNVISGNHARGLVLNTVTNGCAVQGNHIGIGADGTTAIPNAGVGIDLESVTNSTIGGGTPEQGNLVAYNSGHGVRVLRSSTISAQTSNSISNNVIANNNGDGVLVQGRATGNPISMNSIHGNLKLGIDLLSANGEAEGTPTLNDPGDPDTGANNLQNFPVITSAMHIGNSIHMHVTLNSTPSASYIVELFGTTTPDPTGYGEGEFFLGSTTTPMTNASGDVEFDVDFPFVAGTQFVTATATDASSNTSEFGPSFPVSDGVAVVSQKSHGSAGIFSIPMPLFGPSGVEDRTGDGGVAGNHTIVLTYTSPPTGVSASVTSHNPPAGTGNVSNVSVNGNNLIVSLSNVSDRQVLTLNTSGGTVPAVTVPIGFLTGDSNGNRIVNSSDVLQTQSRSGMTVDGGTFRSDVDHNGVINSNDVSRVRANNGAGIP